MNTPQWDKLAILIQKLEQASEAVGRAQGAEVKSAEEKRHDARAELYDALGFETPERDDC